MHTRYDGNLGQLYNDKDVEINIVHMLHETSFQFICPVHVK